MGPLLLDFVYLLILFFGLPFAVYKALTSSRFRAGWGERFGGVPDLPAQRRIWVHCASVGETLLARSLVATLESEYPGADVVVSTNTNTGRETAERNFPGHTVFYFPLDFSLVVRRVFKRIKPSAVVLVELEVWPNFLAVARARGVPVAVVNGRITEKSAASYRRLGPFSRRMFRGVCHFAVQNGEYAARLRSLGVTGDRISISGTMKYDSVATEIEPDVVEAYRRQLRLKPDDVVLLAGCTHPGEEALLIDYLKGRQPSDTPLRLILAPRHRGRSDAVAALIDRSGLIAVRKTALDAGAVPEDFGSRRHVVLVDTTGELARLYAVATVVFVGGSLVEHGGQNMIEPAALGKAVVFGPHTWNFRDTVELLLGAGGAVQVPGPEGLPAALDRLLSDPARREELGARARRMVEESKGATQRNFEAVKPFLDGDE